MMGLLVFSLSSEANYEIIILLFENILFKSLFTFFITAIFYHFISGLRHLVMDFGYWETLKAGRMSALATFVSTGLFFFSFLYLSW
jgi:succinate dehydrogenase / fumarate reductase cytochrome b subunit